MSNANPNSSSVDKKHSDPAKTPVAVVGVETLLQQLSTEEGRAAFLADSASVRSLGKLLGLVPNDNDASSSEDKKEESGSFSPFINLQPFKTPFEEFVVENIARAKHALGMKQISEKAVNTLLTILEYDSKMEISLIPPILGIYDNKTLEGDGKTITSGSVEVAFRCHKTRYGMRDLIVCFDRTTTKTKKPEKDDEDDENEDEEKKSSSSSSSSSAVVAPKQPKSKSTVTHGAAEISRARCERIMTESSSRKFMERLIRRFTTRVTKMNTVAVRMFADIRAARFNGMMYLLHCNAQLKTGYSNVGYRISDSDVIIAAKTEFSTEFVSEFLRWTSRIRDEPSLIRLQLSNLKNSAVKSLKTSPLVDGTTGGKRLNLKDPVKVTVHKRKAVEPSPSAAPTSDKKSKIDTPPPSVPEPEKEEEESDHEDSEDENYEPEKADSSSEDEGEEQPTRNGVTSSSSSSDPIVIE